VITNDGKRHIKRYIAGQVGQIAESIGIGIGSTSPTLTDKSLNFETARFPIDSITYDGGTDQIVFKGTVPSVYSGSIFEAALFTGDNSEIDGSGSVMLADFSEDEEWSAGTLYTTQARLGSDGLRFQPAASATLTATRASAVDLTTYSVNDEFVVAFYTNNSNASEIRITLSVDSANYYTGTIGTIGAAGYKVRSIKKGNFIATGNPKWDEIESISISVVATSGGAADVLLDGLQIADRDFTSVDNVMIVREIVTPFTKVVGSENEIELRLSVTV